MDTNWNDQAYIKNKYKSGVYSENGKMKNKGKDVTDKDLEELLRKEYLKINEIPEWAKDDQEKETKNKEIIHDSIIKNRKIKKSIRPLCIANLECQLPKLSSVIAFHPTQNMLVTAGRHQHFQIFKIDDKNAKSFKNNKIECFPIYCAGFTKNGDEILFSSQRSHLYFYDLESGQGSYLNQIQGRPEKSWEKFCTSLSGEDIALIGENGAIPILSVKSRYVTQCLNHSIPITDIQFSKNDNNILYCLGNNGDIFSWDLRMNRCLRKISIPRLYDATVLSISNHQMMAVGSSSGLITLIDLKNFNKNSSENDLILKEFGNLTYSTSFVKFNDKSKLLCFGTELQRKGLRMVDLENMCVLSDWPFTQEDNGIHKIYGIDFSYDGRYLAMGNCDGKIYIHEISVN